jgi:hypothetical protein
MRTCAHAYMRMTRKIHFSPSGPNSSTVGFFRGDHPRGEVRRDCGRSRASGGCGPAWAGWCRRRRREVCWSAGCSGAAGCAVSGAGFVGEAEESLAGDPQVVNLPVGFSRVGDWCGVPCGLPSPPPGPPNRACASRAHDVTGIVHRLVRAVTLAYVPGQAYVWDRLSHTPSSRSAHRGRADAFSAGDELIARVCAAACGSPGSASRGATPDGRVLQRHCADTVARAARPPGRPARSGRPAGRDHAANRRVLQGRTCRPGLVLASRALEEIAHLSWTPAGGPASTTAVSARGPGLIRSGHNR